LPQSGRLAAMAQKRAQVTIYDLKTLQLLPELSRRL